MKEVQKIWGNGLTYTQPTMYDCPNSRVPGFDVHNRNITLRNHIFTRIVIGVTWLPIVIISYNDLADNDTNSDSVLTRHNMPYQVSW